MVTIRWNRWTSAVLSLLLSLVLAAPEASPQEPGRFGRRAVPGPDDIPAFPDPPAGFDVRREDVPHGRLEMVTYDSESVGTVRRIQVYTPPGYSDDVEYPVLYLLHGIGGDETEWQRLGRPNILLDNTIRGDSGGQFGPGRRRFGGGSPPSPQDLKAQADAYAGLFAIFIKHEDVIDRVTFWGLSDRRTWRRGQHPLIFDVNNQRKLAYGAIVDALLEPNPDLGTPP